VKEGTFVSSLPWR